MLYNTLPGRPIYIKLAADHVSVTFEKVPVPLLISQVDEALEAFNNAEWTYLQNLWWERYDYLKEAPGNIAQLIAHLDNNTHYNADSLLQLGEVLGIYGLYDLITQERDWMRLSVLPSLLNWDQRGTAPISDLGQQSPAWTGKMWKVALQEATAQVHKSGLKVTKSASQPMPFMPMDQAASAQNSLQL